MARSQEEWTSPKCLGLNVPDAIVHHFNASQ